jgi:hypothetical protein
VNHFLLMAGLALLTGCAGARHLKEWGALTQPEGGCPNFSGEYDLSVSYCPKTLNVFSAYSKDAMRADRMSVIQAGCENFRIVFLKEGKEFFSSDFVPAEQGYAWNGPYLESQRGVPEFSDESQERGVILKWNRLRIAKAEDGSLVSNYRDRLAGTILFLPVFAPWVESWCRLKRHSNR